MLKAGVGCDYADPLDENAKPPPVNFCSAGAGAPIEKFGVGEDAQPVNTYHLVRYAFGKNCNLDTMTLNKLKPLTGSRTSSETKRGWTCREINLIDGAPSDLNPAKWTYITLTTKGALAAIDPDDSDVPILGLDPDDDYFSHNWRQGKVCDRVNAC